MPLGSSRFYLSGYLHYYGHIRLPRQWCDFHRVRVSHVHALPSPCTQHHFTPDICWNAILPFLLPAFQASSLSDGLADVISLTRLN